MHANISYSIEELSYFLKVGLQCSSPAVMAALLQINTDLHLQQPLPLSLHQVQEVSLAQVLDWLVPQVLHSSTSMDIIYHLNSTGSVCTYMLYLYMYICIHLYMFN